MAAKNDPGSANFFLGSRSICYAQIDEIKNELSMRSMWQGSISFGMVNIPVEMYRGSREREFKFVLLHDKDYSQIRYARICKEEEKEVPWSHVVRGYEAEKGKYIVMSDEDFEKVAKERCPCSFFKGFGT